MTDTTPGWQDDEFAELAGELRQRMGREFQLEAEELERLAAQGALRKRSLADVAVELLHRGDVVVVATRDRTVMGTIVYAYGTLATLETRTGIVDVNLGGPVALRIVERARSGGLSRARGSPTFRARLFEYEQSGEPLELVAPELGETIRGRITVVGKDHVVVEDADGVEWFVPDRSLALVLPAPSRPERPHG